MTGTKQLMSFVFQGYGIREAKCKGKTHFYLTAVSNLHLWTYRSVNSGGL